MNGNVNYHFFPFFISFRFISFAVALWCYGVSSISTQSHITQSKADQTKREEKTMYMIQLVDNQHLCRSNMAYVRFYFIDINIEAQQGNILWSQMFSIVSMLHIYELKFQCYAVHCTLYTTAFHHTSYTPSASIQLVGFLQEKKISFLFFPVIFQSD